MRRPCFGRVFDSRRHHQYQKANRSRLACFIAGSRVFAGVSAGSCGLHDAAWSPVQGPIPLSPGHSPPSLASVKNPKSASTAKAVVTNQRVTRGLFKRLDGVIACPEEAADLGLLVQLPEAASMLSEGFTSTRDDLSGNLQKLQPTADDWPRASFFNDQQRLNYNLTTK
jgi:hypothetical protein